MSIAIELNGEKVEAPSSNLEKSLSAMTQEKRFAVAVNGEFVPASGYAAYTLKPGDSVVLVSPMQGG